MKSSNRRGGFSFRDSLHLWCLLGSLAPLYLVILFVTSYSPPFPIEDQWMSSFDIAIATADGTISFADLTAVTAGGHRLLFTHLHTVLFTYLLNWSPHLEAFVNPFLATLNFGLLVLLFRRTHPELVHVVLIPFSMLVFSLYQEVNWMMSWESGWHFVNFFLLAALWVLAVARPGWRPIMLAGLLTLCAALSRSHGILGCIIVPAMLWMRGYRRWRDFLLWSAIAAGLIAVYLSGSGISLDSEPGGAWNSPDLGQPLTILRMVLGQIGASMGAGSYPLSIAVGAVGLALLAANALCVKRREIAVEAWNTLSVWLSIAAYAIGSSILICVARREVLGEEAVAMLRGYTTTSIMMWVALFALMATATWGIVRQPSPKPRHRLLAFVNLIVVSLLTPLYLQTQIQTGQYVALYFGNYLGATDSGYMARVKQCMRDYPLTRDESCMRDMVAHWIAPSGTRLYMLAAYGLSIFAEEEEEAASILPDEYQPDSPVVVNTRSPWLSVYVRDRMLPNVSEDLIVNLSPTESRRSMDHFPRPLKNHWPTLSDDLLDKLDPAGLESDRVWYITTPEAAYQDLNFSYALEKLGYREVPCEITHPRYQDSKFDVHAFTFVGFDILP